MSHVKSYFGSVLRELGLIVRNWGDMEWSIAFVVLLGLGFMFLKGNAGKKSL